APAGLVRARARRARLRAHLAAHPLIDQRGQVAVGLEDHVAAPAAVAAVGPAERDVLLAAEALASVTTGARPHGDRGLVDERLVVGVHREPRARRVGPQPAPLVFARLSARCAKLAAAADASDDPPARSAVVDHAVLEREECVVAPHADAAPRVDARAHLPHQDRTGLHALSREHLDPAPLRLAVAPVARAALPLLVRHACPTSDRPVFWSSLAFGRCALRLPLSLDRLDADLGEILPVARPAPVVLAPLHLEDADLRPAALRGDRADCLRAGDQRLADARVAIAAHEQHLGELDAIADGTRKLLHAHGLARLDAVLLATRADHRVHHESSLFWRRGRMEASLSPSTGPRPGSGLSSSSSCAAGSAADPVAPGSSAFSTGAGSASGAGGGAAAAARRVSSSARARAAAVRRADSAAAPSPRLSSHGTRVLTDAPRSSAPAPNRSWGRPRRGRTPISRPSCSQ